MYLRIERTECLHKRRQKIIKVVFMGTPDFAVPCLKALIDNNYEVLAVVSQPDKPKGRSMTLSPTPIKALALEHNIPVWQPTKLRDGIVYNQLKELNPDIIVVVAYGRILPKDILNLPKYGCINIHGSLLPKYRGSAPIQWSVIDGEKVTGVTSMYLAEGMDTGDMILTSETPIGENETSGELFERLAPIGADCLIKTLKAIEDGTAPRIEQEHDKATMAPMLTKETGHIDFNKSAQEIHNLVRGTNPWPTAYFTAFNGKVIKVYSTEVVDKTGAVGEILENKELVVACGEKAIKLISVKPEGKGLVDGFAYMNGVRLKKGDKLI